MIKNVFKKFGKDKSEDQEEPQPQESKETDPTAPADPNAPEEEANPNEEEDNLAPEEVMIMQKGDYSVHVLVEEIKNWGTATKKDQLPYPSIKITCLGKTVRTTKTKIPVSNYQFDEHFYFNKSDLTVEMLDSEKIIIEAFDSKHNSRKDYYGITEFDFEYIYNRKDHALRNYWIALANPESEDITKIKGYLKVSISVLHSSDPRVDLTCSDSSSECFTPTQVKVKYKELSLYFFRGEELPNLDESINVNVKKFFKSKQKTVQYNNCDGYIEVNYMAIVQKTKVVKMEKNVCIWNQIIDIPVRMPPISQKIVLFVKDYDTIGGDDYAGSIELSLDDIDKGKYKEPQYLPVYGAPTNDNKEKYHKMMYTNSEVASTWNGRILMKVESNLVDSPYLNIRTITDNNLLTEVNNLPMPCVWKVYAKLYDAMFLPIKGKKKYSIVIQMDQQVKEFDGLELCKDSRSDLNINKCAELTIKTNSNDINSLPDLFVYLKYDGYNYCFQRFKPSVLHCNNDILLVKLMQDPCFKKVSNSMDSGLLRMKLCVHNPENDPPIDDEIKQKFALTALDSNYDLPDPSEVRNSDDNFVNSYTVVAIVYMSKELIAADKDGTSDPYVKLTLPKLNQNLDGKGETIKDERQTRKIMNTTNGIWNEKLVFENVDFALNIKATWPVFLLQVFDWNKTGDVPIGYSYVWLNETSYKINDINKITPKWHQLSLPKSNKKQGQILLSFYIFDRNNTSRISEIKYKPDTTTYSCEINILGLRQLKPLSLLPVKKPYIKFNMNSLNVTGENKNALQNIQTIPSDTGTDPTINTVIKFDLQLPKDKELMPELQCEVYDHLLNGIANSLLGVFNIDLNSEIEYTNKSMDEDLKITSKSIGLSALKGSINSLLKKSGIDQENDKEKDKDKDKDKENDKDKFSISTNGPKKTERENIEMTKTSSLGKREPLIDKSNKQGGDIEIPMVQLGNKNQMISSSTSSSFSSLPQSDFNKVNSIKSLAFTNEDILLMPYDSKMFMLLPRIKKLEIPGYKSIAENQNNQNVPNVPNAQNNQNAPNVPKEKIQKDFWVEDKLNPLPEDRYFPVGYIIKVDEQYGKWDPVKDRSKITKHYRRKFNLPLENINDPEFIRGSPFDSFPIKRGKYNDKESETKLFEEMADINSKIIGKNGPGATMERIRKKEEQEQEEKLKKLEEDKSKNSQSLGYFISQSDEGQKNYGYFKGIFVLAEKEKMTKYSNSTKKYLEKKKTDTSIISTDTKEFENFNRYDKLRKDILSKKSVVIRIYVLELNNLAKRDLLSESDPYIKIYLNNKEQVNERKNYQNDEKNCKWYRYYDIPGTMPGSSTLKLEVWDYDDLFSDDLIGQTVIDLEDRYFDESWRHLEHKPIELRPLVHPDYLEPQGDALIWVEIIDMDKRESDLPWNIQPEPSQDYECRFVVWDCEGMDLMDEEGTSDLYVVGFIDMKDKQKTDVHFRSQDGNGSFNWRMLFPMTTPYGKNKLNIQVYDKDLFAHDDFICDAVMDLSRLLDICKLTGLPIKFDRDFYEGLNMEEKRAYGDYEFLSKDEDPEGIKFYVKCYNKEGVNENRRVLISVEILPKGLAEMAKVGKGREEINANPYLPPPTGRIVCSLNPFKMLRQCVGKKFRVKVCLFLVLIIVIIAVVILVPYWVITKGFSKLKA